MQNRIKASQLPAVKKLLLEAQPQCALCTRDFSSMESKRICVDHDHKSGHIRALLCTNCNQIEGKIHNLVVRSGRGWERTAYLTRLQAYWEVDYSGNPVHHKHVTEEEKRAARNAKARAKRKAT